MDNDIRKLINDNWEDIKELIVQKAEAEQKPKTIWDLNIEDGEEYYGIEPDGEVMRHMFDDVFDEDAREMGNAFLTEEEAEFECERRKIEAIMRKYSKPFKFNKHNYCLVYNYYNESVNIESYGVFNCGVSCFETKEIAQQVIDKIGEDRLKKYWFGVKE
jgi:hypothetical protein